MITETSYCSEEFLDKAVTIHDTRADSFLVWLVDFESKVATSGTPSMYERQEWNAFNLPTSEKFVEFLNAQIPQSEEAETSQEYVAIFAEHQKRQLRLSVATRILTALIQADAMAYTTAMSIAVNDHDALASVEEVLDNRNTQTQIISEALSYADLFLNEVFGQQ